MGEFAKGFDLRRKEPCDWQGLFIPISQVRKVQSLKAICGTFGCGLPSTQLLLEEVGICGSYHVPVMTVRWCEAARAQGRWGAWWKEQQARVRLPGRVSPLL